MKKTVSVLLLLCMLVSLFSGLAFSASAEGAEKECDLESVFTSDMYVAKNEAAGLQGKVLVSFDDLDVLGCVGTVYLPGCADESQLFLSWDDSSITVSCDGTVYESGAAPVPAAGDSAVFKITKGLAFAYVTVKTCKGSSGVSAMFLNLDESLGTIDAMNSDETKETQCFGSLNFEGEDFPYISMKGRGNSTWVFDKKPYNITFHKKADYDKKQNVELIQGVEAKKWSLLANYFDNSLLRNKIALDLAQLLECSAGTDFRFGELGEEDVLTAVAVVVEGDVNRSVRPLVAVRIGALRRTVQHQAALPRLAVVARQVGRQVNAPRRGVDARAVLDEQPVPAPELPREKARRAVDEIRPRRRP